MSRGDQKTIEVVSALTHGVEAFAVMKHRGSVTNQPFEALILTFREESNLIWSLV